MYVSVSYAVSVFHILILNAGIVRNCNITFQVLCLFNVLCNSLSVSQNPNKSPIKSNSKPQSTLSKYWMDTIQEMYTRMRKAESRVRGLTYQKKLILLQLGGYEVTIIYFLCPRMMCFLSFSLRLQYTAAWVHLSSNTLTVILNGLTPMTAMFVSYNCLYFSRSVKLKR